MYSTLPHWPFNTFTNCSWRRIKLYLGFFSHPVSHSRSLLFVFFFLSFLAAWKNMLNKMCDLPLLFKSMADRPTQQTFSCSTRQCACYFVRQSRHTGGRLELGWLWWWWCPPLMGDFPEPWAAWVNFGPGWTPAATFVFFFFFFKWNSSLVSLSCHQ